MTGMKYINGSCARFSCAKTNYGGRINNDIPIRRTPTRTTFITFGCALELAGNCVPRGRRLFDMLPRSQDAAETGKLPPSHGVTARLASRAGR